MRSCTCHVPNSYLLFWSGSILNSYVYYSTAKHLDWYKNKIIIRLLLIFLYTHFHKFQYVYVLFIELYYKTSFWWICAPAHLPLPVFAIGFGTFPRRFLCIYQGFTPFTFMKLPLQSYHCQKSPFLPRVLVMLCQNFHNSLSVLRPYSSTTVKRSYTSDNCHSSVLLIRPNNIFN